MAPHFEQNIASVYVWQVGGIDPCACVAGTWADAARNKAMAEMCNWKRSLTLSFSVLVVTLGQRDG